MQPITFEELSKLVYDNIAAQEKSRIEYEARQKNLERQLGKLGNSYGEQIEAMFVNLSQKFNALGYEFPKENEGATRFRDKNKKIIAEVDRFLENGEAVMAVEVKAKLKKEDVDEHIKRLEKISKYNEAHNDKRKVLGAVAGGIVSNNILNYAQNRGLYVLMQSGESIEIATLPEGFKAKEW